MNVEAPKRIVCAAMKMKDGTTIVGVRHFSPDMRATMKRIYGDDYKYLVAEQGFIDTWANFLTREEAWVAALANGQILRPLPGREGTLYSENLY